MFRFGFLLRFLLTLLIIGGLVAGGVALYRLGWAQGYQASVLMSGKAGAPAQPVLPAPYYGYPIMPYYGWGFGVPFFPLIGIGFFLFFLFIIGGLFRFGMYRRWAQAGHGPWEGHGGPWGWHDREPNKGQPEKGQEAPKES